MDRQRRMMIFWLCLEAIIHPVFSEEWGASVSHDIKALVTSCVVVPCSFTYPGDKLPSSKLRGIWHLRSRQSQNIYHEDKINIEENFRGRTKLLGRLGDGNCTLEMVDVKDHDNGPFCFRIEIPENDKFSFLEECVHLEMLPDPPKPKLIHPKKAIQGHPYTTTCSISHTCPSRMPKLTWSKGSKDEIIGDHKDNGFGNWETQSILTFIPAEKDDHSEITCTATFEGGRNSSETLQLFVKRKENYFHIIIPVTVGVGTAVVFGALCVLMMKKYKRRIADLQSSGDGSMWNRLSRMSRRIRSGGSGPFNPEQQRSPKDMINLGAVHKPNNMSSTTFVTQKISKPRFPSPKSQPKSGTNYNEDFDDDGEADYTADLSIYGNI